MQLSSPHMPKTIPVKVDFVPSVISECSDKTLSYSISFENEQLGNLSIRINLESELTHDVVFKYLFHRLI